MKTIVEFIEQQARAFADAPFFHFLRDERLDPRQRFSFVPCLAPWAFGFADLNKYVLRDDASADSIQRMVNTHTSEDDDHWRMYLQDVETLGMNDVQDFNSVLKLLWGEESQRTRRVVYELAGLIPSADPVLRIILIKALEESSHLSFKEAFQVAEAFRRLTGRQLAFFGDSHLALEGEHTMREAEAEEKLQAIQLTPAQREQARAAVARVFQLMRGMMDELLEYAQRHPRPLPLPAA